MQNKTYACNIINNNSATTYLFIGPNENAAKCILNLNLIPALILRLSNKIVYLKSPLERQLNSTINSIRPFSVETNINSSDLAYYTDE